MHKKVASDECIASWRHRFISRDNIHDIHAVEDGFHILLPGSVVEGVELKVMWDTLKDRLDTTATYIGGIIDSLIGGRGVVEG